MMWKNVKSRINAIKMDNANWSFGGNVSKQFDAHITQSVPLYDEGHDLIVKIADFFLSNNSTCYELGCSTGTLLEKLAKRCESKKVSLIGVDCEQDMIAQAKQTLSAFTNIELITSDIFDVEFEKPDLIIAYYTMQFIKPARRQEIFDRIYQSLNWGGGFLLFEKVRGPDARFQDMMTTIYTDYKLDQGHTEKDIIAKSRSLKGVLEPFSTQGNLDLLQRAGFVDVMSVMKYVCFEGFLAIK